MGAPLHRVALELIRGLRVLADARSRPLGYRRMAVGPVAPSMRVALQELMNPGP